MTRVLAFDPIKEARRQWEARWPAATAMSAATSIMRAQQIVLRAVDASLRDFDLTFARYEALVLLLFSKRAALPMVKMSERLMIHPTSVTNIIDRLERQGYVVRRNHLRDGRTTMVHLTGSGRRAVERATVAVCSTDFGMVGLTDRELEVLFTLLARLRQRSGDFYGS
jgi:DNA-binding MarR family transcriptional regulator